ncbi:hypothetical protein BLNAU_7889 [Blattamonas nauphoetae]|uniref:RRM domain-containing protein n=1 Tax=Blattamonas nauphoetae TaxID=2049346 RepID=A0ABQ9Y006_9EUKA|nr:hypothetical protein BLNAU_7889 [Blattamonas nauphoetae]
MENQPAEGTRLFVGNLEHTTDAEALGHFFEQYGIVTNATIATRHDEPLGYGFVTMETKKDADNAKEKGDKQVLDGRQLRVEIAQDRTDFPARRGRGRYGPPRGDYPQRRYDDRRGYGDRDGYGRQGGYRRDNRYQQEGDKGRDEGRFDRERPMSQYAERGPRREFRRDQDGYGQDRGYGRDKEYQQGGRYERRGGYSRDGGYQRDQRYGQDRRYEREGDRYGRDGGYNRGAGYPREGGHNAPQRYHHSEGYDNQRYRHEGGYHDNQQFRREGGGYGRGYRRFGGRGRYGGQRRERRQIDPNTPRSTTRVHISNIPFTLTEAELLEAFKRFDVQEVSLRQRRYDSSQNVGYGFIIFKNEAAQKKALAEQQDITFGDRACRLSPAFDFPESQ